MRAMQVPAWGAEIVEAEIVEARPAGDKVRVRVAAATVNPVDPVTAAGAGLAGAEPPATRLA